MDSYAPRRGQGGGDMYQFRGRDDNHPPRGGTDSYRPRNFTFRQNNRDDRPVPKFSQQSQQPPLRPRNQPRSAHPKAHPRGGRQPDNKGFRQNYPPKPNRFAPTSNRPLLRSQRAPTPEQLHGMNEGPARFKALEDLSNSEEEDMELDSDVENQSVDSHEITEEPARKRVQLSRESAGGNNPAQQPKWSNPDPYTALPPPDETQAKRKDVVKLIRKAKASAAGSKASAAEVDDFISFAMDDYEDDESSREARDTLTEGIGVPGAPTGPRFSHLDNLHSNRNAPGALAPTLSVDALGPPPPPPSELDDVMNGEVIETWPPPKPQEPNEPNKSRKRARTEISDDAKSGDKRGKSSARGSVIPMWNPKKGQNPTPWVTVDHSSCESMGIRLHKEVCDFYDYVKPREFENEMRHALVRRVARFVRDKFDAEVAFFGSFAAGTYLPDADMDLVVISQQFRRTGRPILGQNRKQIFAFANLLTSAGIAKPGSTCPIWKAKVPIVKYVDSYTGLRCDISFENNTGPTANRTYAEWKAQFPAMPIIVSIVKHFLLMRGLNEVHSGGLGSFSVNCLVVSLMQHMPQIISGNMDPSKHLGEILMNFFDFYGNKFDQSTTGIQMRPPRYFPKHLETRVRYNPNTLWKLSILDPNRQENDISSGTTNIVSIFGTFAAAYKSLQDRMNELRAQRAKPNGATGAKKYSDTSILASVFAGNYESFERQRQLMKRLHAAG